MSCHGRHSDRITDEAALWFVRAQDPEFSTEERKALASWLAGSAEHVREYLSLAAVSQDIQSLSSTPSIGELVESARKGPDDANVVEFSAEGSSRLDSAETTDCSTREGSSRTRRRSVWATAAIASLALAGPLFYAITSAPDAYSTGIGEQMSFPLQDGSVVTLNAQSSLEVAYSDAERNVRVIQGEALFTVAKDADRPFQVHTRRAVVRAVGTQFNVRFRGEDTTVTVVEGVVEVQPAAGERDHTGKGTDPGGSVADPGVSVDKSVDEPQWIRLAAGQQARVPPLSGQVAVAHTKVDQATSWRERRLSFDAWPLRKVVDEFNLYNDQRIVIQDEALGGIPISGVFSADDRASFALFLDEAGLALVARRANGTIVLRSADGGQ
jgi:transmembrane sensor